MLLAISDFTTEFSTMVSGVTSIFSSIFTLITGNWLMMGSLAITVIIPIIFALYSKFKGS